MLKQNHLDKINSSEEEEEQKGLNGNSVTTVPRTNSSDTTDLNYFSNSEDNTKLINIGIVSA